MSSRSSLFAPLNGKVPPPPLCVQCKHYVPPPPHLHSNKTFGTCKKSAMVNVVDGSIAYTNVEIYRLHVCKGDLYEKR